MGHSLEPQEWATPSGDPQIAGWWIDALSGGSASVKQRRKADRLTPALPQWCRSSIYARRARLRLSCIGFALVGKAMSSKPSPAFHDIGQDRLRDCKWVIR